MSQILQYNFKEGVKFYDEKVYEFMRSLGYEHDRKKHSYKIIRENNNRVAMFAHGGFGAAFFSSLLDIPYPQIIQYNSDSHLYKDGLHTKHCNRIDI